MIDSHCHLDHSPLYEKLDEVVNRAQLIGVKFLLTISTNLKSFEIVKTIISKYENIYGTLGIHPHETKEFLKVDKSFILSIIIIICSSLLIGESKDYNSYKSLIVVVSTFLILLSFKKGT